MNLPFASLRAISVTLVLFSRSCSAIKSFETNCTLPTTVTSYVSAPDTRGSLDIFWTSLATIFACTYSTLHLNVPEQRLDRDPGIIGDIKWAAKSIWISVFWTTVTILMPEFMLVKAIKEWWSARELLRELRKLPDARGWTLSHLFFANMGGFAVEHLVKPRATSSYDPGADATLLASHTSPNVQAHDSDPGSGNGLHEREDLPEHVNSGLFSDVRVADQADAKHKSTTAFNNHPGTTPHGSKSIVTEETGSHSSLPARILHIDGSCLQVAIREGILSPEVPLTREALLDRSKSDIVTKGIAALQILYFVLGILVRVGRKLPISQLELGTTAFVACSAVMYGFLLWKPKSVSTVTVVKQYTAVGSAPSNAPWLSKGRGKLWEVDGPYDFPSEGDPLPNQYVPSTDGDAGLDTILLLLISIPFGAIHIAGWNLIFPSNVDLWLWRSSALCSTTIMPVCVMSLAALLNSPMSFNSRYRTEILGGAIQGTTALYLCSRLIIIVEMFRGLFYLPPEAYLVTWTANIPHIS